MTNEEHTELWLTPETRIVTMPDGTTRPLTYSMLTWDAYDDLIDLGYEHAWLISLAESRESWPEGLPFEMRLSSTIAYVHKEHRERFGPAGFAHG